MAGTEGLVEREEEEHEAERVDNDAQVIEDVHPALRVEILDVEGDAEVDSSTTRPVVPGQQGIHEEGNEGDGDGNETQGGDVHEGPRDQGERRGILGVLEENHDDDDDGQNDATDDTDGGLGGRDA